MPVDAISQMLYVFDFQLCEESLIYASDILVKATERVTEISDVTKHVDRDIISVAIVGSSNIVAAASDPRVNGETAKPVVERTRWSIHNLTQVGFFPS